MVSGVATTQRRAAKRAAEEAQKRLERFVRTERWNSLDPGDPVRIQGIKGGLWRYKSHVTNVDNGEMWIEVLELEPVPGVPVAAARRDVRNTRVRCMRTFAMDRVLPLPRRRPQATTRERQGEQEAFDF
jgi:hypothetical protein